jgi:hypothetical protein
MPIESADESVLFVRQTLGTSTRTMTDQHQRTRPGSGKSFHSSLSTHPSLYRQKTALIVTTRTIILMRLFIPLERSVLHIRDTHTQIDHDKLSIIIIAIPNQRSVKKISFAEKKKVN